MYSWANYCQIFDWINVGLDIAGREGAGHVAGVDDANDSTGRHSVQLKNQCLSLVNVPNKLTNDSSNETTLLSCKLQLYGVPQHLLCLIARPSVCQVP